MKTVLRTVWRAVCGLVAAEPDSESEKKHAETRRNRPELVDAEFYETFYGDTGIPQAIPARLRELLASIIGDNLAAMQPQDNIAAIYEGIDFADILYRVEREFGLKIPLTVALFQPSSDSPRSCPVDRIDGTFDSLVRYVSARLSAV